MAAAKHSNVHLQGLVHACTQVLGITVASGWHY